MTELEPPTLVENDNTIVCGSSDGHVYLLNAKSGTRKFKINFDIEITSVPAVVENKLYVFDNEGLLHRIDAL